MFTSIASDSTRTVTIYFEGRALIVHEGQSVAAVLLEAGITHFRDAPVTAAPRAPFCMMGVCFDCLVVIDGLPNQQSCMIEARDHMRIERQVNTADEQTRTPPTFGTTT